MLTNRFKPVKLQSYMEQIKANVFIYMIGIKNKPYTCYNKVFNKMTYEKISLCSMTISTVQRPVFSKFCTP